MIDANVTRFGSWSRDVVKQREGSKNCVACVAAMISQMPLTYVHDWLNVPMDEPVMDQELYAYLYAHGFALCHGFQYNYARFEGDYRQHSLELRSEWKFENNAAYIAVRSMTNPEWFHAVFWNGMEVLDPNPSVESLPLGSYEIDTVVPVYRDGATVRWAERLNAMAGVRD